jgi:hypothetical protein
MHDEPATFKEMSEAVKIHFSRKPPSSQSGVTTLEMSAFGRQTLFVDLAGRKPRLFYRSS